MKIDIAERDSATIRAFPEDGEKKLVIQIEDKAGDIFAYIKLSPEKASGFADGVAIYVARMSMEERAEANKPHASSAKSVLLCRSGQS